MTTDTGLERKEMMSNPVKEEFEAWAVRIDGNSRQGRQGFALDGNGGRSLYHDERDATRYCQELQSHISSKCTVVRCNVSITETTEQESLRSGGDE